MIKIENVEVFGWEAAIRGMRNPMNSWEKSDSMFGVDLTIPYYQNNVVILMDKYGVQTYIGDNDLKLMEKLVKAGSDHSKFMRMINVTLDITAPRYWWAEADTYKVGTVRNSCSTMHKIAEKEFTMEDFSHEHLNGETDYDENYLIVGSIYILKGVIEELNFFRKKYLETNHKDYWWQMIQLLPSSYNQRATVQLNYAVLRNIYHSRKNHKLDEWVEFCKWIETLPYSELITCDQKE